MFRSAAVALLFLLASLARAQSDDPDEEIARRRFRAGQQYYAQSDYEKALVEFEAARKVKEAPALDYNIARCLDRLEQFERAVVEYERYLKKMPDAADAPEVRMRVEKLKARIQPPPTEPPKPEPLKPEPPKPEPPPKVEPLVTPTVIAAPKRASWTPSIAVGVGTLAVAVIGAGLLGSAASDYNHLDSTCGRGGACPPSEVDPVASRAYAGYAFLGIAAALAVVDVALIAVTARRR
jgi:tetratricopeptide (TPR) repeat protein